jgi:hypothetical protein
MTPTGKAQAMADEVKRARGRPKGSKKRGLGDNGPSEDDILLAVHELSDLNSQRAELGAKVSAARKRIKARGIELGDLDVTMKMLEWAPGEVRTAFMRRAFYAQTLNLAAGDLLDLFEEREGVEDPEVDDRRWYNVGRKDGLAGRGWPDEAPEGCPEEHAKAYGDGHEAGAEVVRQAFLRRQQSVAPPTAASIAASDPEEPDAPTADEVEFAEAE